MLNGIEPRTCIPDGRGYTSSDSTIEYLPRWLPHDMIVMLHAKWHRAPDVHPRWQRFACAWLALEGFRGSTVHIWVVGSGP
ncbi:Uncharacterized protein TCM_000180 [Theobroma cacao]|uniref:Uncharacterized protein n=1 Tax=Theobroma cacao TaxID=3641 RepID=A0A061DGJ3_THECC|nr:Uncharacterized protein TCM_000180 [Theobroma cacao]